MEELLAREDVTPNTTGIDGRTPLSWAARNGHANVMQILLEWGDSTPRTVDGGSIVEHLSRGRLEMDIGVL